MPRPERYLHRFFTALISRIEPDLRQLNISKKITDILSVILLNLVSYIKVLQIAPKKCIIFCSESCLIIWGYFRLSAEASEKKKRRIGSCFGEGTEREDGKQTP